MSASGVEGVVRIEGRDVVVTGLTGFLGSALAPLLVARGARVHALARPSSERAHLARLPIAWYEADLLDAESLEAALGAVRGGAGGDLLAIHAAGAISYDPGKRELLRRTNVEGTRLFLEACKRSGVRRVLHVSSVVACGHAQDARSTLDEEAPFNGAGLRSAYVTTKRAAEDYALAVGSELEVVAALPGAIFGPSSRPSNTRRFLAAVAEGTLGPLAPPGSLSVVGLEDAADGLVRALEQGRPGRRYLLTESTWRVADLLRLAARVLGVRGPRRVCPESLWPLVVGGASLLDRLRPLAPATPESLRLLGAHFRFDSRRAREELGWGPRPFESVLRRTLALPSEAENVSRMPGTDVGSEA